MRVCVCVFVYLYKGDLNPVSMWSLSLSQSKKPLDRYRRLRRSREFPFRALTS